MIDFERAYEYQINQDLIFKLWIKKGYPNTLRIRTPYGCISTCRKTPQGILQTQGYRDLVMLDEEG